MPIGTLLRRLTVREAAPTPPPPAERRAAVLPTPEIAPWAESCLYAIGRSLSEWNRAPTQVEHLEEAAAAAESLQVLLAELRRRVM